MSKNTKIINADKDFVNIIRKKWPRLKDPERTRMVASRLITEDTVSRTMEEMLYGKRKKIK